MRKEDRLERVVRNPCYSCNGRGYVETRIYRPNPDCSVCKGTGVEEYESHHSGNYEETDCKCMYDQKWS